MLRKRNTKAIGGRINSEIIALMMYVSARFERYSALG